MTNDQLGDLIHIATADGSELFFGDEEFRLLAYGNFGASPTSYITRRGYKQNGATEIDFLLDPRTITVELWRSPACDRQTYWDNRLALHEFLRPNRNGPIIFTLRTPNGDLRSLTVRADPGLVFPPQSNNNDWNIQESLDFICFDPLFFNSAVSTTVLSSSTQLQLIFPITFPISFGTSDTFLTTGSITYAGTWKSYPTITLIGSYTRAVITNVEAGVALFMGVAIAAGEQRIIDLTPGSQSITDANGVNKFSDLGVGSNLVDFAIYPDPEVAGGIQTITVQMVAAVGASASISYYERFFAI